VSDSELVRQALDPRHSVVVEACAGSGKTWLLVSRILRLLLDGAAPGEILAITYTRKAAREIEERLADWLRQLAVGERRCGARLPASARCRRSRSRPSCYAGARPLRTGAVGPAAAHRQHLPWLVRPPGAGRAAFQRHGRLRPARIRRPPAEEVWQRFAAECGARAGRRRQPCCSCCSIDRSGGDAQASVRTRRSPRRMAGPCRRRGGGGGAGAGRTARMPRRRRGTCRHRPAVRRRAVHAQAARLRRHPAAQRTGERSTGRRRLEGLSGRPPTIRPRFARIAALLLTREGTLRQRKSAKKDQERFGAVGAAFRRTACLAGRAGAGNPRRPARGGGLPAQPTGLCRRGRLAGRAREYKRERRLMDFADLEWHVSRMLADESQRGLPAGPARCALPAHPARRIPGYQSLAMADPACLAGRLRGCGGKRAAGLRGG
jgi:ATP-dependent helicase/nuclease subunit A